MQRHAPVDGRELANGATLDATGILTVIVFGGAGAFGRRFVHALARTGGYNIIIAGRDEARAASVVSELRAAWPGVAAGTATLDRTRVDATALAALKPFVTVDLAGPFQGADHRLPQAAINAGVHYIDIADGRDFVAGFATLKAAARAAGVVALTGCSSTPALSNAVLDMLTDGWRSVDTIEIAISPGNRAPRGLSVVEAILSWTGRPVRVFLDGRWQTRPGWGMLTRRPMGDHGSRWLSLCETPDLDIVPARFCVRCSAIFRAGLELPALHLGLWAASLSVRAGLLRSLRPLARPFRAIADLLGRFGSDRGFMVVEARGTAPDGACVRAVWTLMAEAGDGPNIPILPALAAIRALDAGLFPPGAYPCVGVLPLAQIESEFAPFRIATSVATETSHPKSIFVQALGARFVVLPQAVRDGHTACAWHEMRGRARIDGAATGFGWLVARLFGFPRAGSDVPVHVSMDRTNGDERWTRDFGGKRFVSVLSFNDRRGLEERFGPFTFSLEVAADDQRLTLEVRGWRLGPLPLPTFLAPTSTAFETVDDAGRFNFDVDIALPLVGRIVHYRGWLEEVEPQWEQAMRDNPSAARLGILESNRPCSKAG